MKMPPSLHEGECAIVFTQKNKFPGNLIQWRYGCEYTHVALLRKVDGQYLVEDSDIRLFSSGINRCSWDNWKHKKYYIDYIMISPNLIDQDRYGDSLGSRYDLLSWFKHLGLWRSWKKNKRSANAFTCWEWIYYILELPNWWKAKPTKFDNLN